MADKFAFLTSNRFWALVITSLAIVANGNFSKNAWLKGVITLALGFTTVRTVDRATEPQTDVTPLRQTQVQASETER